MKMVLPALALALLFASCDQFQKEKISSEIYLEEELNSIDWNEVDAYPLFNTCKESTFKSVQKSCFETTLHKHIQSIISNRELISHHLIVDTLFVNITISHNGEVAIAEIKGDSITFMTFPEIKEDLYAGVKTLPEVKPALKRGVPVNTKFTMPVVINTD